jgi:hypothetical protein
MGPPRGNSSPGLLALALAVVGFLLTAAEPSPAATTDPADEVVLVEPNGRWHIRQPGQDDYTFFYGNPGDIPLLGDWESCCRSIRISSGPRHRGAGSLRLDPTGASRPPKPTPIEDA